MKASEICNPAWNIWVELYGAEPRDFAWYARHPDVLERRRPDLRDTFGWVNEHNIRRSVIDHMSFAIPDPDTLDLVAEYGPILEIGAGTGYWAWCLQQLGVDVLPFDRYPPQTHPHDEHRSKGRNAWFDGYWTQVFRGDASYAGRYPERSLMLVWPYMDNMAIQALRAYQGDTVIYVGEDRGACATGAFFDVLEDEWTREIERVIPQWSGLHDELWVLKRRSR